MAQGANGLEHALGKALFDRLWHPAPASTGATDGLGPLLNARGCAECHPAAGRARAGGPGLVLVLGGDPVYGRQLQTTAIPGHRPEGRIGLRLVPAMRDGVRLERPVFHVEAGAYGPLRTSGLSPRRAPPLLGLGLIDRLPDEAIRVHADPEDRDGDGISGRARLVPDENGRERVGRFGLKAEQATLAEQVAAAFRDDLGLSTPFHPDPAGDCTAAQPACRAGPHGAAAGEAEIGAEIVAFVTAYLGALRPPSGRAGGEGEAVFARTGCAACHSPGLTAAGMPPVRAYSDLLLHDLGPDLADQGPGGDAEWRTAPLWGLGRALAKGERLMHDGRARDAEEAILWHGGEAEAARDRFAALPPRERAALLAWLGGL